MRTLRWTRQICLLWALAVFLPVLGAPAAAQTPSLPSPQQFFGFEMGADRKLAGWDKLHEYYQVLAKGSDRMKLVELGKTSEGRPYIALFISSPANLAKLDQYREMNAKLADPRGVPEAEIERIIQQGKAVVIQSFGLHSTEVAAAQTAAQFVHES
ncbi:MAG: M14 family zinc carboxypeptidase [Vicinamibacterales bacterium]